MAKATDRSLLVIGECMMELSGDEQTYTRAFAGDTYNSAVYAKRCHGELDVQILTAIGQDPISQAMVAQWDRDRIGHALVMISDHAVPGVYAISTDDRGERSFTYWRRASAATEFMSLMDEQTYQQLQAFDYVFFSGITLAILSDDDKSAFLTLIDKLGTQGKTIAFDPNYRPILWRDKGHATHWLSQAYGLADIALPGLADHQEVFGHQSNEDVLDFLQGFEIGEIVLKAESDGIFGYLKGQEPVHQAIIPAEALDTTGAGDSFAGTYLAERLTGAAMPSALASAARVASLVVQHRGAIIDEALYRQHLRSA